MEANKSKFKNRVKTKRIRMRMQVKLSILLVMLMFFIISIQTAILGVAEAYLENLLVLNIFSGVVSLVLASIGAYIIIRIIIKKPLSQLTELANSFKENDFTKRVEMKTGDEFEQLGDIFNGTADQMEKLLRDIQESSNLLDKRTTEMNIAVTETQSSSEQIAASTEQSSTGIEQMSNDVNQIVEETNEMVTAIQQVSNSVEKVDDSSSEVIDFVKEGKGAIKNSIERAKLTKDKVDNSINMVNKLSGKSEAVNDVIVIISDIAEQTNLLALNAAIEAARAGEAGKGFAVVADEVRKLANQSKDSTTKIQDLIRDIQIGISEIVEDTKTSGNEVDLMVQQVMGTEENINDIEKATGNIKLQIQEIQQAINDLSQSSSQINASVTNTSAVLEETKAGNQEIAASTVQQSSTMQQLSAMSNELQGLSNKLDNVVKSFKVV